MDTFEGGGENLEVNSLVKGGVWHEVLFYNICVPFATTRSFFIQIHQTKFYTVF